MKTFAVSRLCARKAGPLKENSIAVLRGEVRKTAMPEPAKVPPWILINHLTQG